MKTPFPYLIVMREAMWTGQPAVGTRWQRRRFYKVFWIGGTLIEISGRMSGEFAIVGHSKDKPGSKRFFKRGFAIYRHEGSYAMAYVGKTVVIRNKNKSPYGPMVSDTVNMVLRP